MAYSQPKGKLSLGIQGKWTILRQRQREVRYTAVLTCWTIARIHQITQYVTNTIIVAFQVKLWCRLVHKRLKWYAVEMLGSWRLRPLTVLWNTDVPCLHGSEGNYTWKAGLHPHCEFDYEASEFTKGYDSHHCHERSNMHPTHMHRGTAELMLSPVSGKELVMNKLIDTMQERIHTRTRIKIGKRTWQYRTSILRIGKSLFIWLHGLRD